MYDLSAATSAGATQASTVYSPVASIKSWIFLLDEVEACALPPPAPIETPHPPAQVKLPESVKSADGSTPLVS